jgi:hypothetical protein
MAWNRNGLQAKKDPLRLSCRVHIGGGYWKDVEETVRTVRTIRKGFKRQ